MSTSIPYSPSLVLGSIVEPAAMDNLLAYLNDNCVPSAYWAGGPGWGTYKLAIEPRNGKERPQMELMRKHLANDCTAIGPTPAQIAD